MKSESTRTIKVLSDSKSSPTKQQITNTGDGDTTLAEGGVSSKTSHQDDGDPVAESKYKQEELLQSFATSSAFAVPMSPRFVKSVFVVLVSQGVFVTLSVFPTMTIYLLLFCTFIFETCSDVLLFNS